MLIASSYPFLDVIWTIPRDRPVGDLVLDPDHRVQRPVPPPRHRRWGEGAVDDLRDHPAVPRRVHLPARRAQRHGGTQRDAIKQQQSQMDDYVRSVAAKGTIRPSRSPRPRSCWTTARSPRPSSTASRRRRWASRRPGCLTVAVDVRMAVAVPMAPARLAGTRVVLTFGWAAGGGAAVETTVTTLSGWLARAGGRPTAAAAGLDDVGVVAAGREHT